MPIFRKKPVEIEARELTPETAGDIVAWLAEHGVEAKSWSKPPMRALFGLLIPTLESPHEASWGDYVIKGIAGEFYPCKSDIFVNSYEAVEPKRKDTPLVKEKKDFLFRVKHNRALKISNRNQDRIRQACRRDGYAKVVMNPRRWVITPEGENYLNG